MKIINNLKGAFFKDIAYTTIGQIVVMVLLFLINKILSIKLGPEYYAIYSISNKTASVVGFSMLFSFGIALPRYLPEYLTDERYGYAAIFIKISLAIMGIIALVWFIGGAFFSVYLSNLIYSDEAFSMLVIYVFLYAFAIAMSSYLFAFYRGTNNFEWYSKAQIIVYIIMFSIAVVLGDVIDYVFLYWGIGVILFSMICFTFSYNKFFKNHLTPKTCMSTDCFSEIMKFCLPRLPGELILFCFNAVPLMILAKKIGFLETAAFSVAIVINSTVTPLYGLVGTVLLPYISGQKNKFSNRVNSKINILLKLYCLSSVVFIILVFVFSDFFIDILFSAEYVRYSYIIQIMIFSILPNSIYLLLRNPLDAVSVFPYNTINVLIAFIVLNLFLILGDNQIIYAWGFVISYSVLGLLSLGCWCFLKRAKIRIET